MTELELRQKVVAQFEAWLGYSEADGRYRKIVDLYNAILPIPVGYVLKYSDEWCAATVSAVGQTLGMTDVILPECSCPRMIELYAERGRWIEDDAYVPQIGDIIMYDWQDTGAGDNRGNPDHVGMVAAVNGTTLTIIEGNNGNAVAYRTLQVNGRYIRGYCLPDYASKATSSPGGGGIAETIAHGVEDIGLDATYWTRVLGGQAVASGQNIKALMDKYHIAMLGPDDTVENAVEDVRMDSPDYWLDVIEGRREASPANVKALMDKYHEALAEVK